MPYLLCIMLNSKEVRTWTCDLKLVWDLVYCAFLAEFSFSWCFVQFLNMSHRSFSMGVLPMVRWKNSCSIFSELTKRRDGSRSNILPNLDGQEQRRVSLIFSILPFAWQNSQTLDVPLFEKLCMLSENKDVAGSPGTLAGVYWMDVLTQQHLRLVLQILHLLWVFETACLCSRKSKRRL